MRNQRVATIRHPLPAASRLVLVSLLALAGILGTIQVSQAAQGDPPFQVRINGELSIWSGTAMDRASAYPNQRGYDLTPVMDSADRAVTGCSGSIALSATPAVLETYARLQSDPGPGCAQSSVQGVAEVRDTLRFWASPENLGDPLRLDIEFAFPGSHTYDVDGWPDADSYMEYGLEVTLIEVAQTYPDGSIEWGAQLGEVVAKRAFGAGVIPHELVNLDDLELVPSDASGEFGPGQNLTLRVTTKRGAQIYLWWTLYSIVTFDNGDGPSSGTEVAVVEADFGSSLELASAVVRDPSDESLVTDSGLVAASGFDYLAVPEPGRALAVITALCTLVALRRQSPWYAAGSSSCTNCELE